MSRICHLEALKERRGLPNNRHRMYGMVHGASHASGSEGEKGGNDSMDSLLVPAQTGAGERRGKIFSQKMTGNKQGLSLLYNVQPEPHFVLREIILAFLRETHCTYKRYFLYSRFGRSPPPPRWPRQVRGRRREEGMMDA